MSNRDAMSKLDELLGEFDVEEEPVNNTPQQQYQRTTQRTTMEQIDHLLEDTNSTKQQQQRYSKNNRATGVNNNYRATGVNNNYRATGVNNRATGVKNSYRATGVNNRATGVKNSYRATGVNNRATGVNNSYRATGVNNRATGVNNSYRQTNGSMRQTGYNNPQSSYRQTHATGGDEDLDLLLDQFNDTSLQSQRIRDSELPPVRATGVNNRATGVNMLSTGPGRQTMGTSRGAPMMSTGVPRAKMSTGPGRQTMGASVTAPMMSTGVPRNSRLTIGNDQRITGPGRYTHKPSLGIQPEEPQQRSVIATGRINNPVPQRQRKMASQTPTGEQVVHVGPACDSCGEKIIGRVVYASGKPYHSNCIKCSVCSKPLAGKKFTRKDGKLLCLDDYYNIYAPRCYNCKGRIKKKCITVKQAEGVPARKYHTEHFLCTSCGCELSGKPYKVDLDGDPFCLKCFGERIRDIPAPEHICKMCKRPIVGDYIKIGGQYIHPEHYECDTCRKPFFGGDCWEYEGLLYCHEHYLQMLKKVCAACRKPIVGRSLSALGRVWHPEHFVCHHCHLPFGDAGFWEKYGNPYCKNHYFQLFGQMCQKCGEPAVTDTIQAFGRAWHKEHFECGSCGKNLAGKRNIYNFQDKPLCWSCFGKLPKEVQKEIKRRRAGKKEAIKRRKKLQKNGEIQKTAPSKELLVQDDLTHN